MKLGSHKIDSKFRTFVKHLNLEKHQICWSTNRAIKDFRFGAASHCTEAICLRMDNHKDNRCRSLKTSNHLVFTAKLLNDCLPTSDVLLHRYKGLDIDPNCTF